MLGTSENAAQGHLLIVDDDAVLRGALEQWLRLSGFTTQSAAAVSEAIHQLENGRFDAVLADLRMPGEDGIALLRKVQARWPGLPLVLLTGHGDVPQAVEALKLGAFDFLTKPHDPDRLAVTLRNACEQRRLRRQLERLSGDLDESDPVAMRLVGRSDAMRRLQHAVRALLNAPLDVLLRGETGAGKEVVARTLHECGPRAAKPFVAINCAAMPAEIIESELFGHESGAFTGARQARVGKFEFANGGTVFLDEIESMPASAQAKLLRVLQERMVERVGGNRAVPIDIRVVSAAKVDLKVLARNGGFRDDLYYRLAGYELDLPPLRARGEDVLLLFQRFAAQAAQRAGQAARPLSPLNASALLDHDWPGNVRELRLVAERFGLGLGLDIDGAVRETMAPDARPTLEALVDAYERKLIVATLHETGGSVAQAMEILGVPRRTLNDKMRRLGIQRPREA
ncbi:MAG: sigma-54 dependent transcriptional regulator [Proteobacteria bacterium]|nr:sigma-54 dependent transcriptional regulator [Pseudomonadota bacterium]